MHCWVVNIVYKNENKITVTFATKICEIKEFWGDHTQKLDFLFFIRLKKTVSITENTSLDSLFSSAVTFKWAFLTIDYHTLSPFLPLFSEFYVIFLMATHTHTNTHA